MSPGLTSMQKVKWVQNGAGVNSFVLQLSVVLHHTFLKSNVGQRRKRQWSYGSQ